MLEKNSHDRRISKKPKEKENILKHMTDNMYFFKKFNVDHTAFGGKIYPSDFDRKTTLSEAAARIEYDKKFDRQCKKNKELNHE